MWFVIGNVIVVETHDDVYLSSLDCGEVAATLGQAPRSTLHRTIRSLVRQLGSVEPKSRRAVTPVQRRLPRGQVGYYDVPAPVSTYFCVMSEFGILRGAGQNISCLVHPSLTKTLSSVQEWLPRAKSRLSSVAQHCKFPMSA